MYIFYLVHNSYRIFYDDVNYLFFSWVQKNHPRSCERVSLPPASNGDTLRNMTVLLYLDVLHNEHANSDEEEEEEEGDVMLDAEGNCFFFS